MMTSTTRRLGALLALVALTASCSPDRVTGVQEPTASNGLLDGIGGLIGGTLTGLLTCNVTETRTTTQVVGPAGGTIFVGRHSVSIPAYALDHDVEITATAPAGNRVELELLPHGLQFERRATLRMSYANCGLVRALLLRVVYVDDDGATILEVLPSIVDLWRQQVYGTTDHFSSYMLAY
jgi:hypothetical protein